VNADITDLKSAADPDAVERQEGRPGRKGRVPVPAVETVRHHAVTAAKRQPFIEIAEDDDRKVLGIVFHRADQGPCLAAAAEYGEPDMR